MVIKDFYFYQSIINESLFQAHGAYKCTEDRQKIFTTDIRR